MPKSYSAADWFWIANDGPAGQVYASRRFAYVPAASDVEYLAFLAGGDQATRIVSEAELRDELEKWDVPFLALPLRALELTRPRTHRARVRLVRTGQSIASGTGGLIQWGAAGSIDPSGMNNPAGPNPDRVVIPAGQDGVYLAVIAASFAPNAVGDRAIQLRRNANPIPRATVRQRAPATDTAELVASRLVQLSGSDIVRVAVAQDSGGALLVDAELQLLRIE